jgi:MFS family permease
MKNRKPVNKYFIFFSFFLIDFLVAFQFSALNVFWLKIPEISAVPEKFAEWMVWSYIYAIFATVILFLLTSNVFEKKEGIRKFFTEGVVYFVLGSIICYYANGYTLLIFGRIVQGLGAGIILLSEIRLGKFLSAQNLRSMSLFAAGGLAVGLIMGNHASVMSDFFSFELRTIFILAILGSVAVFVAISDFFAHWKKRFATWGIGYTADTLFSYAFDFLLYPFVIWKLGLLNGLLVMFPLSFLICWLNLVFYDWLKIDYLAIETIKELREYKGRSRLRRFISVLLHKGGILAFAFLSLNFDPFVTTVYMRHGAHKYDGLSRRDWMIFITSVFVGNVYWALVAFGIVSAFEFFI